MDGQSPLRTEYLVVCPGLRFVFVFSVGTPSIPSGAGSGPSIVDHVSLYKHNMISSTTTMDHDELQHESACEVPKPQQRSL